MTIRLILQILIQYMTGLICQVRRGKATFFFFNFIC